MFPLNQQAKVNYTNRIQGIYSTGNIMSIHHIGNDEGRRPETFSYMLGGTLYSQ